MAILADCFKLERLVPRITSSQTMSLMMPSVMSKAASCGHKQGGLLWLSANMSSFAGEKARHPAQGSKRSQEADRESMEHRAGVLPAV